MIQAGFSASFNALVAREKAFHHDYVFRVAWRLPLRMPLYSKNRKFAMVEGFDDAAIGKRRRLEAFREAVRVHSAAMVGIDCPSASPSEQDWAVSDGGDVMPFPCVESGVDGKQPASEMVAEVLHSPANSEDWETALDCEVDKGLFRRVSRRAVANVVAAAQDEGVDGEFLGYAPGVIAAVRHREPG